MSDSDSEVCFVLANLVLILICMMLFGYLLAALLWPEKF